jgi:hypothetical protein
VHRAAATRPAPSPLGSLRGDALAAVLSFALARDLLFQLPLVCRAFRDCIFTAPHAWPPRLHLVNVPLRNYVRLADARRAGARAPQTARACTCATCGSGSSRRSLA